MLCTSIAWAGPGPSKLGSGKFYQGLICNPIPDKVEVTLKNSQNNTIIDKPSIRELEGLMQDGAKIIIPSPDYATLLPPSLRRQGRPELLEVVKTSQTIITKPRIYVYCYDEGVLLKDCSNRSTPFEESIKTFNFSENKGDYIEGSSWLLKRSDNYPDYWSFSGKVRVFDTDGNLKHYPVSLHYYSCTLEKFDDVGMIDKLKKDNSEYIKYIK